jgi:EpsI family protein
MHPPVPALRNLLVVGALIVVALVAYWPSTSALWNHWGQDPYLGGHGPLIAAISAWLLLRSRAELAQTAMRPSLWGCIALAICCAASLLFWRSALQEPQLLLLPLLVLLTVLAACGGGAARVVAFPVGYLYFAEPAWRVLTWPLQALTVQAVRVLGPLVGLPVESSGTLLHLAHGVTFEVTPLCSGVNFLLVGLAVAALIGELQRASLRRRAALLAAMALITIVSNWVRVLMIMVAGVGSGMRLVVATQGHVLFGWVFFALVMLGFAALVARRPAAARHTAEATAPGLPGAPLGAAWPAAAVLVSLPLLARALPAMFQQGAGSLALQLPRATSGWQGPLAATDALWKPEFVGAHSEWHVAYRETTGAIVELVAIGYPSQEQDRKLVNAGNSLLGSDDLTPVSDATVVRGAQAHIEFLASDTREHRFVVWSVYDIGGRQFVTPLFSQLWYGLRSLGGPPYSVLFAYRTICEPSCDAARARLARFELSVASGITISDNRATPAARDGPMA